eukprot:g19545.t1
MADWDDLAASCHQRFERLQALRRQEGLDALLIAIGPDAAFSRANEAVFNWLMLGLSGREALSSVSGQYEESLVCLGPRSLIFCKKGDFEDLSLRTARWEQCFLVAPEENDQERYEEKKIGTFIEMVKDCRKLGVFASQSEIHQDPLMNLEPQMRQIFSAWDLTAMHWAKQTLPKLHKAWTDALLFHDQHSREEALAAAPIVDYFIYGRLDDEVQTAISPSPRLLVGKHTSQILTPAVPEEVTVMDEDGARQMIWEAVDPITGVALTRTYGLTTPFDPKMKEVLFTYAACCRCCRAPEVFDCHIDAFGVSHAAESRPGLCLRFLRVACRLPDATLVAYGDSSFGDGTALGESSTVPSWAFLPAPSEEARSLEEPIDVEAFCELAVADASGDGESGVCGYAAGSAWSYASGKVVVSTGRSGYLVLKCKGSTSSLPASKGQLWVSMEAEPPVPWLRVALSVSPNALSTWRQELPSSAGDAELSWIESGTSSAVVAPAPPRPATADEGRKQKQLLVTGLPGCVSTCQIRLGGKHFKIVFEKRLSAYVTLGADPAIAYPWQTVRHPLLHRQTPPNAPLTGELLEAVRAVPAPVLNRVPHTTGPSVFRCFVPCGVLDLHLLRSRLSACLDEAAEQFCKPPLAKASPWKGLFCVEVKALTVESSDSFWSKGDVDLSSSSSSLVEKNLVLTSKGELARTQWQELLSSEETIPEDVRLKVAHDLRQEGAPEGYSFDGHRYINQEDYSSQRDHPFLAQRLTQLASEHNAAQASRCHRAREVLASPPFTRPMSPTGRPSAGRPPRPSGYPHWPFQPGAPCSASFDEGRRFEARRVHRAIAEEVSSQLACSDLLGALRAFGEICIDQRTPCVVVFQEIDESRLQLLEMLEPLGRDTRHCGLGGSNGELAPCLAGLLCAASFPQLALAIPKDQWTGRGMLSELFVHEKGTLVPVQELIETTRLYVRCITCIPPLTLLLFGGLLSESEQLKSNPLGEEAFLQLGSFKWILPKELSDQMLGMDCPHS